MWETISELMDLLKVVVGLEAQRLLQTRVEVQRNVVVLEDLIEQGQLLLVLSVLIIVALQNGGERAARE